MSSKTSCFSPTLFAHNLKRFWPLSIAVLVTVILIPGFSILAARSMVDSPEHLLSTVRDNIYVIGTPMVLLMTAACLLVALIVFNYLHRRAKIRFYHGLPMNRICSFLTSYLSGLAIIALPLFIGLLICWGFAAIVGAPGAGGAIFALMGASLACLLFFFSLAVLSCVLCGNPLGSILVYAALNFIVMVLIMGSCTLVGQLMPGIDISQLTEQPLGLLCPAAALIEAGLPVYGEPSVPDYYSAINGFLKPWVFVGYGIAGILFAFLDAWIYRIRKDETAGDTVSFRVVRSVCKVLFALAVSAGCALMVVEATNSGVPLSTPVLLLIHVVGLILGWFIAEMVVRRSLKVVDKRSLRSCGILVLALLLAAGLAWVDAFGLVRRVPEPQKVEKATVGYDYNYLDVEAEDAVALHQELLDNRKLLGTKGGLIWYKDSRPLQIDYVLVNGHEIHRDYLIMDAGKGNDVEAIMSRFLSDFDYAHQYWLSGLDYGEITEDNLVSGSIFYYPDAQQEVYDGAEVEGVEAEEGVDERLLPNVDNGLPVYFEIDGDEAFQMYQAFLADLRQGVLDPDLNWNAGESYGGIEFRVIDPRGQQDYGKMTPQPTVQVENTESISVVIYPGMTNTIQWVSDALARHSLTQKVMSSR